ncbi:hypothetical protein EVAR_45270_1 [Eumeta japonica]|uniref:Uncharacterized protein n=1 Tax=Eumeta variegata TaxID=151549 RepID=A0A4C1XDS1_EUMVA|nr:hypothetical protein EVAR_45270_1 [Eumeta japonica]
MSRIENYRGVVRFRDEQKVCYDVEARQRGIQLSAHIRSRQISKPTGYRIRSIIVLKAPLSIKTASGSGRLSCANSATGGRRRGDRAGPSADKKRHEPCSRSWRCGAAGGSPARRVRGKCYILSRLTPGWEVGFSSPAKRSHPRLYLTLPVTETVPQEIRALCAAITSSYKLQIVLFTSRELRQFNPRRQSVNFLLSFRICYVTMSKKLPSSILAVSVRGVGQTAFLQMFLAFGVTYIVLR